jgi:hypothetical protein
MIRPTCCSSAVPTLIPLRAALITKSGSSNDRPLWVDRQHLPSIFKLPPVHPATEPKPDPPGAIDGDHDMVNMPLEDVPKRVRDDLKAVHTQSSDAA